MALTRTGRSLMFLYTPFWAQCEWGPSPKSWPSPHYCGTSQNCVYYLERFRLRSDCLFLEVYGLEALWGPWHPQGTWYLFWVHCGSYSSRCVGWRWSLATKNGMARLHSQRSQVWGPIVPSMVPRCCVGCTGDLSVVLGYEASGTKTVGGDGWWTSWLLSKCWIMHN